MGGYFYNSEAIHGLISLTLTLASTDSLAISYGWEEERSTASGYYSTNVLIAASTAGGSVTYTFGGESPAYFKIAYSTANVSILSFQIKYSCFDWADPHANASKFTFSTTNTEATSTSCTASGTVAIPATYNGLPVTTIAMQAFNAATSLDNLYIPDSVTTIEGFNFPNCENLETLRFFQNLQSIGNSCFIRTESLTELTFPESFRSLGNGCFTLAESLERLTFENGITTIGSSSFTFAAAITTLTLPDSLATIGDSSFANCSALTQLNFRKWPDHRERKRLFFVRQPSFHQRGFGQSELLLV